eukprot:9165-Heterococcus_DN1.PRE.3
MFNYTFRLWNVLDGKKEQERILYTDEDPVNGFLLNVDTKWRSHPNCEKVPKEQWARHAASSKHTAHCAANSLPKNKIIVIHLKPLRGLHTLRDITGEHLPLLKEIDERPPNYPLTIGIVHTIPYLYCSILLPNMKSSYFIRLYGRVCLHACTAPLHRCAHY